MTLNGCLLCNNRCALVLLLALDTWAPCTASFFAPPILRQLCHWADGNSSPSFVPGEELPLIRCQPRPMWLQGPKCQHLVLRWGGLCSDLWSVWCLSCSILLLPPTYFGLTLTVKLSSSAQGLPSGAWHVKCTSIYNAEIRAQGDRVVCIHGKHQLCSTLCSIAAPNFLPVLILVNKFPPSRPGRITVRTDCSWVRIQPESRKEQSK